MKREKAEKLFYLIGEIDDALIAEAEEYDGKANVVRLGHRNKSLHMFTAAACVIFLVVGAWGLSQLGMGSDSDEMAADSDWAVEEAEVADDADMEEVRIEGALGEEDVTLEVEILDDMTLLSTMTNHSDSVVSPGHPMFEYFDGEAWEAVPLIPSIEYLDFEDIGVVIYPGQEHQFSLDLSLFDIPEGYLLRLRKSVWPDGEWHHEHLHQELTVEFELE
ncbi:MAG: hypothetical protein FWE07_03055 [Turicibacter sp.]|nr:hypothetical protein [Turicibacter sp.]